MSFNIETQEPSVLDSLDGDQEGRSDAPPGSILSTLRTQAQAQLEEHQIDIPVGGEFGNWLQLRYKVLPPEYLDKFISKNMNEDNPQAMNANMDMMAQACVAVIGHDPNVGTKEVLSREDGVPLRLEHALLELLEFPLPPGPPLSSREVIAMLFAKNGVAIGQHGNKLIAWLQSPQSNPVGEI